MQITSLFPLNRQKLHRHIGQQLLHVVMQQVIDIIIRLALAPNGLAD